MAKVNVAIKKNLIVDTKTIEQTLKYFLLEHSARKLNFIYWNLIDSKYMCLCFVNLTGKKLNRLNNSDLGFRIVKVKGRRDWNIVKYLFENFIVSQDDRRAVSVVRLDYLMQYLKTLNFNLDAIDFKINKFGTKYVDYDTKVKPISSIDNDIQSLYLIERLYNKYSAMLEMDESNEDNNIVDITDDFRKSDKFVYVLADAKINVPTHDGLDIISKRFTIKRDKAGEPWDLKRIYIKTGLSNVVSRFTNERMIVLSLRVYLKYFLKTIRKRKKRKKRG